MTLKQALKYATRATSLAISPCRVGPWLVTQYFILRTDEGTDEPPSYMLEKIEERIALYEKELTPRKGKPAAISPTVVSWPNCKVDVREIEGWTISGGRQAGVAEPLASLLVDCTVRRITVRDQPVVAAFRDGQLYAVIAPMRQ